MIFQVCSTITKQWRRRPNRLLPGLVVVGDRYREVFPHADGQVPSLMARCRQCVAGPGCGVQRKCWVIRDIKLLWQINRRYPLISPIQFQSQEVCDSCRRRVWDSTRTLIMRRMVRPNGTDYEVAAQEIVRANLLQGALTPPRPWLAWRWARKGRGSARAAVRYRTVRSRRSTP